LQSSNGAIESDDTSAVWASLRSTNAPISGYYNTTSYLKLQTSNSKIAVDVKMLNDNMGKPTELIMRTSNAPIDASVDLIRPGDQVNGVISGYSVSSITSNGQMDLNFGSQPLRSQLTVDAKSSNALVTVAAHPAYEGAFTLRALNDRLRFDDSRAEDPSGMKRMRSVRTNRLSSGGLAGSSWWGDENNLSSSIHVATSVMSPLDFIL